MSQAPVLATRETRVISPRTQRTSIIVAGFGQNIVLTTVTTFIRGSRPGSP